MIRKIDRETAIELLELEVGHNTSEWDDFNLSFELVEVSINVKSRWIIVHEAIYKDLETGEYWFTSYSVGATECQDEGPYENDGPEILFTQAKPVQVTKTIFKVA